ncbi:MAG: DUF5134 domain-containing protein [Kineosporiaceae bacterium]|jgi:hypothetical protein
MIDNDLVQWTLTVAFTATGLYSLARAVSAGNRDLRIGYAAHALMSAAMVLMAWSWWDRLPVTVYIAVFALATLWYAQLAVRSPAAAGDRDAAGHHDGPGLLWYHAGMMAAMVWMAVVMARMAGSGGDMTGSATAPAPAGGMDAATMGTMGTMGDAAMSGSGSSGTGDMGGMSAGAMDAMGLWNEPSWSVALSAAVVAMFAVAAVIFAVKVVRGRSGGHGASPRYRVEAGINLVMAAGMAGAFLAMG